MAKKSTKKVENKEKKTTEEPTEVENEEQNVASENVSKEENSDKSSENTAKSQSKKGKKKKSSSKKEKEDTTPKEDDSEAAESGANELADQIIAVQEESKEWQNKYMRLSAEFDNYRKRTLKEKTELTKQANGELLKDILPVIDDFERGIDTLDKSDDLSAVKEGVHLIYNKFAEFVRQNGIKEIEAKEKDFDLDFHEALTKIPAPSEELKGKIVDVIEKGYMLNDKVLRFAKVVVGE